MCESVFNKEYELSELVDFVTTKIDANKVSLSTYISTDNMLVDRGGIEPASKLPSSSKFNHFQRGDTLFSNIRTYFRKVWLADFDGGSSPDVLIFRTKDTEILDPTYLYYLLSNEEFVEYTVLTAKGAKMPRGDKAAIMQFKVYLPDITIQRNVASTLVAFDNKRNSNTRANETLEQIAQAIFKSWFVDFEPVKAKMAVLEAGGTAEQVELAAMSAISAKDEAALKQLQAEQPEAYAELAQTAALFPSAMQELKLGEIPENWEVKRVGDYLQTISKTFPLKNAGEVIFLNTGDIKEGVFLHKHKSKVATLPGQAKKSIQKDDILYSEIRPENKRFAYVHFDADEYVVSTKLMVLRAKGNIDSKFLYFLLKQQNVIDHLQILAESRSGTFPQITFEVLSKLEFAAPIDNAITNYFAKNVLSKTMEMTDSNTEENSKLIELRDTLLPKLLSGELPIPENNEEPA